MPGPLAGEAGWAPRFRSGILAFRIARGGRRGHAAPDRRDCARTGSAIT